MQIKTTGAVPLHSHGKWKEIPSVGTDVEQQKALKNLSAVSTASEIIGNFLNCILIVLKYT